MFVRKEYKDDIFIKTTRQRLLKKNLKYIRTNIVKIPIINLPKF